VSGPATGLDDRAFDPLTVSRLMGWEIHPTRATLLAKAIEGGAQVGGFLETAEDVEVETYMDVQDRLGVTWPERIQQQLESPEIVVVVMGPDWLSAKDEYSRRRIDQETDWVHLELRAALDSDAVVIPVLFDGARMPPADALPEALRQLPQRQGLPVRTANFDSDVQPLLRELLEYGASHAGGVYTRSAEDYTDTRWPYPDPPLVVKPAQLSDQELDVALEKMIPDWSRTESPLPEDDRKRRVELHRELEFESFAAALGFMSEVGHFCDGMNHHPRWENVYRTLRVHLSTWDIGHRVSHLDLILAAHIDRTFANRRRGAAQDG
jgi:pterin-4a-carbinolamine dehydratase